MTTIYTLDDFINSGSKLDVAITCAKTESGNNHTGILFKKNGTVKVLHFTWHNRLIFDRDFSAFKKSCWIAFDYFLEENDPENTNQKVLRQYAHRVFDKCAASIPYGLNYFGEEFGREDATLELSANGVGLTCSTFIVAFFKGFGLNLIKHTEWPSRKLDKELQQRIVKGMMEPEVSTEHRDLVKAESVIARFLPEEITASSAYTEPLAGYVFCRDGGIAIEKNYEGNTRMICRPYIKNKLP